MKVNSFIYILFFLISVNAVQAVTIGFTVIDAETDIPLQDSGITINAVGWPPWVRSGLTDQNGDVMFYNAPNNRYYNYVVSKTGYSAYQINGLWISGDVDETVYLERLTGDEWQDLLIIDDNIKITWTSHDDDNVYFGGETLDSKTTTKNIHNSEYIIFDSTTALEKITYFENGTITEWSSVHTPSADMSLQLKPDTEDTNNSGGWFWVNSNGNEFELCVGKAIIELGDTVIDLEGSTYVCFYETRGDTVIPTNWTDIYYIETIAHYKIGNVIHEITGESGLFSIYSNPNMTNTPPYFNTVENGFGTEEGIIEIRARAPDPDLDHINYSINDSRFIYSEDSNNGAIYRWQTAQGDAGIFNVTITATDGEDSVTTSATVTVRKSFSVSLEQGFNLVSIPLTPVLSDYYNLPNFNDSADVVFEPFGNDLIQAWAYDAENNEWLSYSPDSSDNTLQHVKPYQGVWMQIINGGTYNLKDGLQNYPIEFQLFDGLNLIGYPSIQVESVSNVFNNVDYEVIFSEESEWVSNNPDKPGFLNTLTEINPGKAYWVNIDGDSTWSFDGAWFS
ncbi:hypothetical protein HQ529_06405 [Candidatus Woesearchaeota archaeon]|nr:hypothetical protein [Candidatus Woesearchaeota archaeon]